MLQDVEIYRDENGVAHVSGSTEGEVYRGQGYAHGIDRGMQIVLMRILGQGRAAELLDGGDETVAVDTFFRRMNWSGNTRSQVESLPERTRRNLKKYCEGLNQALSQKFPWEMKLLGIAFEPWTCDDSILMTRMVGYLTLSQSQAEMERLLVEMVQAGVPDDKLEALFPGILGGLNRELLQKVTLPERIVNPASLWGIAAPRMMASNNWVVAGSRTNSGLPLLANDPHLEINRLPNVWYEITLRIGERYVMGGSMPGLPGVMTGRTDRVAWGVTYAFADTIDSWIEECRDGKCRRGEDTWVPLQERIEVIRRKKKDEITVRFYENEHGVLDGDPHEPGYYLATRWAAGDVGAGFIDRLFGILDLNTVPEAMKLVAGIETDWSFVLCDGLGNIGFQMSGKVPLRKEGVSGFVPLEGWDAGNDWKGYMDAEALPSCLNPEKGFFVTANNDLNAYGREKPINMPMGPYRADRIAQLLETGEKLRADDMSAIQSDLYSRQAEAFMKVIAPLLPDSQNGRILKEWDLCYTADSLGAWLFERIYRFLYREVFGKNGMGEDAIDHLFNETGIFIDFYLCFDRVLLSGDSAWYNGEAMEKTYRRVISAALEAEAQAWGRDHHFIMSHLLFGGKLPRFLGFDRGPIQGKGGRATVHQGQIYRSAGRVTTFMPSLRMVTDMQQAGYRSSLAGGPSDRRFSRFYCCDLDNWLAGKLKAVMPEAYRKEKFPS